MVIDLEKKSIDSLGIRVRAIMGVPELILLDETISSPDFIKKAEKYINKNIAEYEGLDETLIEIAVVYYICYLLCPGMYARLPKQMENVSTKTVLQAIDWNSMALEMLGKCNEVLEEAIADVNEDGIDYSVSFATLTDASEYPNTSI